MTREEFKDYVSSLGAKPAENWPKQWGSANAIEHWEYGRRPIPKWAQKLLECLRLAQLVEQKSRQSG